MSRTGKVRKIQVAVDPIFGNKLLAKFINCVMKDGKKSVAQKQVYSALDIIKGKDMDALTVFQNAIQNVGPRFEVRARRVGGASYQVPTEIRGDRRISLAIRWIIDAANKRPSKQYHTFAEKLAAELLDVNSNTGEAIRKRDLMHRNAEANKAFAHFRW
ncbi:30S ribosomal protein S7 [Patescibacteria group bacterium]|nr:30S ribosomal protein S7 [Patescibacteria group bacterium]MCL5797879.1 30S ribosomal protein S7 [Patescibacteria group bacterium]